MTVAEEIEKDLPIVRQKAEAGNLLAQYLLGLFLSHPLRERKPENFAEGVSWLELAAQGGDARAAGKLGQIYKEGKVTTPDLAVARMWFEKAASLDPAAGLHLARCYSDGVGGPKDLAKAVDLFQKAAESGNLASCIYLAHAYKEGLMGLTADPAKAKEYLTTKHDAAKRMTDERYKKYMKDVTALIDKRAK